jgi:hypothetical protein
MKRHRPHRVFIPGNHDTVHEVDTAVVSKNGNIVMLDSKATTGHSHMALLLFMEGTFGSGKAAAFVEVAGEQAVLHALGARSIVLGPGASLGPLP